MGESRDRESVAVLLDFAVTSLLGENLAGALPGVLDRLASEFGLRAAAAFRLQPPSVLAAWPPDADRDKLLAQLDQADASLGALVSFAAPVAIALYADTTRWDASARHAAHAVAMLTAAQVRREGEAGHPAGQAERANWLAIISHELRTPLTSIVSFSELIRGEASGLSTDGQQFLDVIERNADRLLRLTGDLLLLDRLAAGALPLEPAPVPATELIAEAVRGATAAAARQGITLTGTATSGPPIPGDARRLAQVLDNLIGNAVKYSHEGDVVRITATYLGSSGSSGSAGSSGSGGPEWRIDVADSGIGIPPGEAGRMFGQFARASNVRTAGLPGTGLGLSIVQLIVGMHGGRVELDSTLGLGSTFRVYLPAASEDS